MSTIRYDHGTSYGEISESGEIVERTGWHDPETVECGCSQTVGKGAYTDVTVDIDGVIITFYHQSPIVIERVDETTISSCGYKTKTTKKRINDTIPPEYTVRQEDSDWYLDTPDGRREFRDGMGI